MDATASRATHAAQPRAANQDHAVIAQRLSQFISRIERLEEEKKGVTADIREVYAEAKAAGFDTKIMRGVIKLRQLDPASRQEVDALTALYMRAVDKNAARPS